MRLLLALFCVVIASTAVSSSNAAPIEPKRVNVWANAVEINNAFLAWRIKDAEGTIIGNMTMGCHGSLTGRVKQRQCNATMALPKGKIHFSGQIRFNTVFSLTITGGTGIFLAQHGVLAAVKYAIGGWKMDVYFFHRSP